MLRAELATAIQNYYQHKALGQAARVLPHAIGGSNPLISGLLEMAAIQGKPELSNEEKLTILLAYDTLPEGSQAKASLQILANRISEDPLVVEVAHMIKAKAMPQSLGEGLKRALIMDESICDVGGLELMMKLLRTDCSKNTEVFDLKIHELGIVNKLMLALPESEQTPSSLELLIRFCKTENIFCVTDCERAVNAFTKLQDQYKTVAVLQEIFKLACKQSDIFNSYEFHYKMDQLNLVLNTSIPAEFRNALVYTVLISGFYQWWAEVEAGLAQEAEARPGFIEPEVRERAAVQLVLAHAYLAVDEKEAAKSCFKEAARLGSKYASNYLDYAHAMPGLYASSSTLSQASGGAASASSRTSPGF
ncbi:MAG: hypothetical protein K0S29_1126 [Gammaproteobacteria bacterium]|nr:hypothetical protein [Gammaproteobacteria bacterium]